VVVILLACPCVMLAGFAFNAGFIRSDQSLKAVAVVVGFAGAVSVQGHDFVSGVCSASATGPVEEEGGIAFSSTTIFMP